MHKYILDSALDIDFPIIIFQFLLVLPLYGASLFLTVLLGIKLVPSDFLISQKRITVFRNTFIISPHLPITTSLQVQM